MTRILTILLAGAALALLPGDVAPAGCRPVAFVHHQKQAAVVFAPQYAQPYYYSVGAPLQYAAMKEQIKAELRAEAQQLQAAPTPETLPITAEIDPWSIAKANCQGCHATNENAKAAMDMSSFGDLSCEDKLACIREIVDGSMPKGKKLSGQDIGDIIGQFASARTAPGANAPVVEQLVVPEPPKPVATVSPWKFKADNVVYAKGWGDVLFKVTGQYKKSGERMYYAENLDSGMKDMRFQEDDLAWKPFEEAEEVPPPPTP